MGCPDGSMVGPSSVIVFTTAAAAAAARLSPPLPRSSTLASATVSAANKRLPIGLLVRSSFETGTPYSKMSKLGVCS